MHACQREIDSSLRIILYDNCTSRLNPPTDDRFMDVLQRLLANTCITTVLLDGNDIIIIIIIVIIGSTRTKPQAWN